MFLGGWYYTYMAVFPPRVPAVLGPRVEFLRDGFRSMVLRNGMAATWEQSHECPCLLLNDGFINLPLGDDFAPAVVSPRSPSTKTPRPDCPECGGKGYVWKSPQDIVTYVSGATTHELEADWTSVPPKAGRRIRTKDKELLDSGELKFTLLAEHRPALGDRLHLINNVMRRNETHFYTGELVSNLRYVIRTIPLDTDPAASLGVTYCYSVDSDLDVAQSGTEKLLGIDFTVEPDGSGIRWINPPEINGRFTITYFGSPRYIITDIPYGFRDHFQEFKLPSVVQVRDVIHAIGKMEFLATSEGSTGGSG